MLFYAFSRMSFSQSISVSLPDTSVKASTVSITIPMRVQSFENIGAVSLIINYNPSVLIYTGLSNTAASNFFAHADTINGIISIAWYSSDGATKIDITDGILLNLNFYFSKGSSVLHFITSQCEISTINGNGLVVNYKDGNIAENVTSILQLIDPHSLPESYILYNNYPNPFNPSTYITFTLPRESKVLLNVYDLLGREAASLVNRILPAGKYKFQFNADMLSSGVYIYRLQTGNQIFTKKMILMK